MTPQTSIHLVWMRLMVCNFSLGDPRPVHIWSRGERRRVHQLPVQVREPGRERPGQGAVLLRGTQRCPNHCHIHR